MSNFCPNCKADLIDEKQVICIKCGKRIKQINPSSETKNNDKNIPKHPQKSSVTILKKNLIFVFLKKISAFIFLVLTLFCTYLYIFNQSLTLSCFKNYIAPYSINIFNIFINFSKDAALNKDKDIYNLCINQMNLEKQFSFNKFTNFYPLDFNVLKNEINNELKMIKISLSLKNNSPLSIKLKKEYFYLTSVKGLNFVKTENEKNEINLKPWKSTEMILIFKNVELSKNNFLKAKLVFNDSKNYAITQINLIFKDKF